MNDLKHIMWCPDESHNVGEIAYKSYDEIITEMELGVNFDQIHLFPDQLGDEFDSIEAKRTHVQMQIALIEIGRALNFRAWIARNDQGIQVGNRRLGDFAGVISTLNEMNILYKPEIKDAAALVDCIWFTMVEIVFQRS